MPFIEAFVIGLLVLYVLGFLISLGVTMTLMVLEVSFSGRKIQLADVANCFRLSAVWFMLLFKLTE